MKEEITNPTIKVVFDFTQEEANAMRIVGDLLDSISSRLDELVYQRNLKNLDVRDNYEQHKDSFCLVDVLVNAREIISALDEVGLEPEDIKDAVDE